MLETHTVETAGRADKVMAELLDISRKRSKDLIEAGNITKDGETLKPKTELKEGDEIQVDMPEPEDLDVKPEDVPLDIVYEDEDILVVNKPKGMVVHPAPGHLSGTLVNAILHHSKDLSGINGVLRPGIVHRIDKDTSGLLVIAKNDKAHQSLADQLQKKTCKREYLAIVHKPFSHTHGTVNAPIGRDEKDRQAMTVTAKNSKEAVTHFEVLKNFENYSYIRCRLETGRTHQIRVHMKYIGHPVAADPKYGPRKTLEADGQLLHAQKLTLVHPTTNEEMTFECEPPEDFKRNLEALESGEQK